MWQPPGLRAAQLQFLKWPLGCEQFALSCLNVPTLHETAWYKNQFWSFPFLNARFIFRPKKSDVLLVWLKKNHMQELMDFQDFDLHTGEGENPIASPTFSHIEYFLSLTFINHFRLNWIKGVRCETAPMSKCLDCTDKWPSKSPQGIFE